MLTFSKINLPAMRVHITAQLFHSDRICSSGSDSILNALSIIRQLRSLLLYTGQYGRSPPFGLPVATKRAMASDQTLATRWTSQLFRHGKSDSAFLAFQKY